jgi:hypothetical protein
MAWDRFGYAYNNAVKYTDPSGHRVCDDSPEECGQAVDDTYDWRFYKLGYQAERTLALLGGKNDLEAMARIIFAAARLYQQWDPFMQALSQIFLGTGHAGAGTLISAVAAGGCGGLGREPRDCPGNTIYFSDTGFHPDFRDEHNQIYHVWGYIAETYKGNIVGKGLAHIGNEVHEFAQSKLQELFDGLNIDSDIGWGTSWQDYVLSEAGMQIGALIADEAITPAELAGVVREMLGPSGSGSNGMLDWLTQTYGPLAGQQ